MITFEEGLGRYTTLEQKNSWISSDIPFTINPLEFDVKEF